MCFMYILSPLNCPIYNIYDTPSPSSPPPPAHRYVVEDIENSTGHCTCQGQLEISHARMPH